ncbi:MAG: hypothetical protein IT369_22600, partial [Candidatus Latescibacteria bacterium]|nr:hypothetical protein [Candidatus Latescibacterota bacterium]
MKVTYLFAALLLASQAATAGSIKGVVKAQLSGAPPSAEVKMSDDPACV